MARTAARKRRDRVRFFWENRAYFEAVRLHNLEVITFRLRRGAFDDPAHQYRNAWLELGFDRASTVPVTP